MNSTSALDALPSDDVGLFRNGLRRLGGAVHSPRENSQTHQSCRMIGSFLYVRSIDVSDVQNSKNNARCGWSSDRGCTLRKMDTSSSEQRADQ